VLEEMIADIDHGLRLEGQGFAELIEGSNVKADEIAHRAYGGWYLSTEEAFSWGLVAGLVINLHYTGNPAQRGERRMPLRAASIM
jgi:hypothetical protein